MVRILERVRTILRNNSDPERVQPIITERVTNGIGVSASVFCEPLRRSYAFLMLAYKNYAILRSLNAAVELDFVRARDFPAIATRAICSEEFIFLLTYTRIVCLHKHHKYRGRAVCGCTPRGCVIFLVHNTQYKTGTDRDLYSRRLINQYRFNGPSFRRVLSAWSFVIDFVLNVSCSAR